MMSDIHELEDHKPAPELRFEEVWTMFQEMSRKLDLRFEELARRFEETDRQFKETDRQFKETDRKISKLGSRLGELVENLVASNLPEKFKARGIFFTRTSLDVVLKNADNTFLAEIDMFLENGSTALAVEVKSKLTVEDVKEHLERMKKLRRYADEHGDSRKFLGAVAGG
ncbi:MAG: hypothetical protein LBU28_02375, partial [Spirochaetaceae bacterium]|nr:hypothetical protein [Spirochaetaceae bacterium]